MKCHYHQIMKTIKSSNVETLIISKINEKKKEEIMELKVIINRLNTRIQKQSSPKHY